MATQDETLFKLRKWEAEVKAKNAAKKLEERLKDGVQVEDVRATVEVAVEVAEEVKKTAETLVKKTEERLKDGLQVQDVIDTLKDVEEVTSSGCWCWTKKPVTSTPGPLATS